MFIISSPPPSFPQQAILQSSPSCHQRLLAPGAVMIATGCAAPLPPHRCIGKYFLVLLHSSVGSRPVHHQKATKMETASLVAPQTLLYLSELGDAG